MKIKALLRGFEEIEVRGSKETEITGLCADSRTVAPGYLFIARKGNALHGSQFVPEAIRAGASAVVTDLYDPFLEVTQIITPEPEKLEPLFAARFYGYPGKELFIAAVTGTKGKTTTTYMIWHLLNVLGKRSGLIGTVETITPQERRPSLLTTHGSIYNQKVLREVVAQGGEALALEVSSHGLEQQRIEGIDLDVAIFTNLYADHLDYHKTIEEYAKAKAKLFSLLDQSSKKKKRALFNADNSWTEFMKSHVQSPFWTIGIEASSDIQASDISFDANGTSFLVRFEEQAVRFNLALMGRFNVYNALCAIGVGLHLGASLQEIAAILTSFQTAPGRLEQIPNARGIHAVVDYAHTGEALENVLHTLREIAKGRIICLFGCGGNRDPGRRKAMGKVAETLADVVIVTSDNPRTEDPQAIMQDILSGFSDPSRARLISDRKEAIFHAFKGASKGDIVLIAGKGHEKVQIFAHQTVPFDDVAIAKEALI